MEQATLFALRPHDFMGITGALVYLGSYAAMQGGLIRGQTFTYAGLTLTAATLVLISLSSDFNLAAAAIQIAFILVSIGGMLRLWHFQTRVRFSEEEDQVIKRLIPGLQNDRARYLLRLGEWHVVGPGENLIEQGHSVRSLSYLAEGRCTVSRDGIEIATVGPGEIIGEMTYLTGSPATATVKAIDHVRLFALETTRLRSTLARHPDFLAEIERAAATVLRVRLQRLTIDAARIRTVLNRIEEVVKERQPEPMPAPTSPNKTPHFVPGAEQ